VRPDLLQAADVSGHGFEDVLVAAQGDRTVYLLRANGKGSFAPPAAIALSGKLSALATWKTPAGETLIVAGVCSATGCGLQLLDGRGGTRAFLPTPDAVTAVQAAILHGHGVVDLIAVAGGKVLLAKGDAVLSKSPEWSTLQVSGAVATAAGSFVYDRRGYQQLAVLDGSGTLHVFARPGVDSSVPTRAEIRTVRRKRGSAASTATVEALGWAEIETISAIAQTGSAPLLQKARVSGSGGDDLLILSGRQFVTLRHVMHNNGQSMATKAVVVVDSTRNVALGVVAARLDADSREGTVVAEGGLSPELAPLPANNTWYVNVQTDGLDDLTTTGRCTSGSMLTCTLRDAVGLANQDAATNIGDGKADTISIPAGTYPLNYNTGVDEFGDATYHMEVEGPINFVGAGQTSVTIDSGANDKIFSIDDPYDPNPSFSQVAFDTYFSGLTLQDGSNPNNINTIASNPDGGVMDWDADGSGDLTFVDVTLQNSSTPWGHGGDVAAFSATDAGSGVLELDSCAVAGGQTAEEGGGVFSSSGVNLVLNGSIFLSNSALISNFGGADPNGIGTGAGVEFYGQGSVASSIANGSIFNSNSATLQGGGVETQDAITITNTSFVSNSVVATPSYGGGLMLDGGLVPISTTVAEDTFTANSAQTSGGAIQEGLSQDDAGQTLTLQYSRIYTNTASVDSGLALGVAGGTSSAETANAEDNWWGCNGAATGTGCDTADVQQSSGTLTLTPYTTLILTLSSTTPPVNTTLTATGSLGQDSNGTTYTTSEDAAYAGVAAGLTITQGASTTNSSATALDSSASITTSATATASGSATVTVDGASVTQSFTVDVPTQLVFTAAPATPITAGGNAGVVQISLEDGGGNVITTGAATSVTLTVAGPAGYSQQYMGTTVSGVVSFDLSAVPLSLVGTYTYTAMSSGLTQAQVNEVVNPGAAASFSVTGYPNPAEIGVGATVTVTALDLYGNVATGFTGTVTLTSSDPHAILGAPYTYQPADDGVAAFNATLNTAGTQSITATSGVITGSQTGIIVGDSIWLVNADSTLVRLNEAGVPTLNVGSSNGTSTLGGVAFDAAGDVWSVANAASSVVEYSSAGAPAAGIPFTAGVNAPTALAIDGAGYVWIANGNNSIDVLNGTGGQVSPSGTYQPPGVSAPSGIIVDSSGSVWITNSGNNSVTKIIGAATPVVTPAVQQVVAGEQGVRP
jgi:predicted outer membrane repeat protein